MASKASPVAREENYSPPTRLASGAEGRGRGPADSGDTDDIAGWRSPRSLPTLLH